MLSTRSLSTNPLFTEVKQVICNICHGTGIMHTWKHAPCPDCHASGWDSAHNHRCLRCVNGFIVVPLDVPCPHCRGIGKKNY